MESLTFKFTVMIMNLASKILISRTLSILISFFLIFGISSFSGHAQDTLFQINDVKLDEVSRTLKIYMNVKNERTNAGIFIDKDKIKVTEAKGGGAAEDMFIYNVGETGIQDIEASTILFILDKSGSMCGSKMRGAKDAIKATLENNNFPPNSTFFTSFHDDTDPIQPLSLDNFDEVVEPIRGCEDKDTDLNATLDSKIDELNNGYQGRKIIFLVTDGRNDIARNQKYEDNPGLIVTDEQILSKVAGLDPNFRIYTYGFGEKASSGDRGLDENFLIAVKDRTPNLEDDYYYNQTAEGLSDTMRTVGQTLVNNLVIEVAPQNLPFKGLTRKITVTYGSLSNSRNYSKGSTGISELPSNTNPSLIFLIGLVFVGLLLVILIILVPLIGFQEFRRKYVMTYQKYVAKTGKSSNKRVQDPYTHDTILPTDLVVVKCQHVNKLDSWQANRNQCAYYPSKCSDGYSDYAQSSSFFKQQGYNKKLNWLWFGAVGGLLAWGLNLLLTYNLGTTEEPKEVFEWLRTLLENNYNYTNEATKESYQFADQLYSQTILGLSFGLMISLALAWVEEYGQARKFNYGRVFLRFIIGGLVAIPIFFLGELFYIYVLNNEFFGGLVIWLLFGTLMALVLSLNSSIEWKKALMGGAIASIIAYLVYFGLTKIDALNDYSQILGFIFYGGILGYIVMSIVESLEKYEIKFLSPSQTAGRSIFISKWLDTKEIDRIWIGTDPGCHVFIKWMDKAVLPKHAALIYDKVDVFLEPNQDAPVLINERNVAVRTKLNNGDIIKLGNASETAFQFIAKQRQDVSNNGTPTTPPRYDTHTEQKIKQQIKITKRT
jgi:hypothetical protein